MLLQAHSARYIRLRSDELDLRCFAHFGKVGILAQEAVARMDGVRIGDLGRADYGRNVEIAAGTFRGTDTDGFVGKSDMQTVAIGFRIDGHGLNAQILAGTDDTNGDFAAIGDEDFLEHVTLTRTNGEQRLSVLHWAAVFHQLGHHGPRDLRFDFVHQLHRFNDTEHLARVHRIAHFDEGRVTGLRGFIICPDDRRFDDVLIRMWRRNGWGASAGLSGFNQSGGHGRARPRGPHKNLRFYLPSNANTGLAPLDFQLGDAAFHHQLDQLFDFVVRHSREVSTPWKCG